MLPPIASFSIRHFSPTTSEWLGLYALEHRESRNIDCEDIIFVMDGNEQLDPMDGGSLVELWAVKVWFAALFRPSVSTFEWLIKDPRAGIRRALSWFVAFSLLNISILVLEPFVLRGVISWDLILGSFFISFFFSALFVFSVAIIGAVAELIGGEGDFSKLLYGFATFGAPLTTIIMILSLVPFSDTLWLLPVVYGFLLGPMVCKAVHQFGWIQVFISQAPILIGAIVLIGFSAIL